MGCMPLTASTLYHVATHVKFGFSQQNLGDQTPWNPQTHVSKLNSRSINLSSCAARTTSTVGIASEIKHYGELRDLASGRYLHAQITVDQLDDDRFLGNCLVEMYGNCNSLEDAKDTFDNMQRINLYSWNILINAYVKNGKCQEALALYHQMQNDFIPDNITFITILNACIGASMLEEGRLVHAMVIESGYYNDVVVRTALVNFYGKCGRLQDATVVFDGMPHENLILSNAMIAAYVQNGYDKEAMDLFEKMKAIGCLLNQATFVCVLDACADEDALEVGHTIHSSIVEFGFSGDDVVETSLFDMYSKCGSLEDTKRVFNKMLVQNVVSWSAMIAACVRNGNSLEGLELFRGMRDAGLEPNRITLVSVIDACADLADLEEGWKLHALLVCDGDDGDLVAGTSLINMYGECGSIDDAKDVFDDMRQHCTVSCTAMIGAHAHNGGSSEALAIFNEMEVEGLVPNRVTFVCVLDACANSELLAEGQKIHLTIATHGYETDVVIGTALVSMYGKCGRLDDAKSLWVRMPCRNVISFNAMIAECTNNGHGDDALSFFYDVYAAELKPSMTTFLCALDACGSMGALEEGRKIHSVLLVGNFTSEVTIGNALIVMYGKCGSADDAKSVFYHLPQWDVVSWSALIAVCAQNGRYEEALAFFHEMQLKGFKPNHVTYVSALDACPGIDTLDVGWKLHASVVGDGFESKIEVGNALVNLYGTSGILSDAKVMFERLLRHDLVSWNTLVAVFARNGQDVDILELFDRMQNEGLKPDHVTFLNVLALCSHLGRVDDARHYFSLVKQAHGLEYTLKHYVRMVDLLGRAGHLDDAEDLINAMPFEHKSSTLWSRLLGSCNIYGDVERGSRAAINLFTLDPSNQASYVTLANMFAGGDR